MNQVPAFKIFKTEERAEVLEEPSVESFVFVMSRMKKHLFRAEQDGTIVQYIPFVSARVGMSFQAVFLTLMFSGILWLFGDTEMASLVAINMVPFFIILTAVMWFLGPQWRKIKIPDAYVNYVRNNLNAVDDPQVRTLKVNVVYTAMIGVDQQMRRERVVVMEPERSAKIQNYFKDMPRPNKPTRVGLDDIPDEDFIQAQKHLTNNPLQS